MEFHWNWGLRDLGMFFTKIFGATFTIACIAAVALLLVAHCAHARDDGRYAGSPLKPWFDNLKSGKGLCADGQSISDPAWRSNGARYQVRLERDWIDVPDDAVITELNRDGQTWVWARRGADWLSIICFMKGSLL
jgi:hypothetical protein